MHHVRSLAPGESHPSVPETRGNGRHAARVPRRPPMVLPDLPHVTVAGVCADTDVETFTVNAEPVERDGAGGSSETTLFLVDGDWGTWIDVVAEDGHGKVTTETRYIEVAPIEVEITSHSDGDVLDATSATIVGTAAGPADLIVMVNGQPATLSSGTLTLTDLPLTEEGNTIAARGWQDHLQHKLCNLRQGPEALGRANEPPLHRGTPDSGKMEVHLGPHGNGK